MAKLPMCRICLAENVRMFKVVNTNLQELYEKLTDIPFITEDSRPMLACFFCCTKLKQCYQLLRQCLEAEELFAQMMNEDYEPDPLLNRDNLEFFSRFVITPTVHISIVDECQTESIDIKEELAAVCEELDFIIEPKEEHQSKEQESENLYNSCTDVADMSPSDLEDDVPLMDFKIEVGKEQEVSKKNRSAREMKRAADATKPKQDARRTKLEDGITAEQTKNDKSDSKVISKTQKHTSKPGPYFKEPYKCNQRRFNPVKKMIQQTRTQIGEKRGEKTFKCDVCQRSFSAKSGLLIHIRIHTGEKPYKCDVCQLSFSAKGGLLKHIRIHTGEKPFKCDVCQRSFSHKGNLSNHIRIHTAKTPYKCNICQRSFNEKSYLTQHIRIHTCEKSYKCNVCQHSFSLKSYLTKHIRVHTDEKPYKCDVCQRSFREKRHLPEHMRIHTGERPYKCHICWRSFKQKAHLSTHIRIHTGEKPYKCDVCQRSYSLKGHLSKHIRIHTGEKPYKCDVCQHRFNQKSNLMVHYRIHTGEKLYT